MEFPSGAIRLERALAALLLCGLGALCWLESRSPLAAALREQTPWLFWLALEPSAQPREEGNSAGDSPLLFLALYRPSRRTLDLIYVPEEGPSGAYGRSLAEAGKKIAVRAMAEAARERVFPYLPDPPPQALPPLIYEKASWPGGEPPMAARAWLAQRSFWKGLFQKPSPQEEEPSSIGRFDRLLLGLEILRLPRQALRPAWLPEGPARRAFLARLFSAQARPPTRPVTVEVFNASGLKGLASEATKILRSKGADVVSYGNQAPGARTLIYDRLGRIENAQAVREMLGCPAAEALTRVSPKSLVDVTVVLARDCGTQNELRSF